MTSFSGFPAGKTRFTPLPDLFFTELLPAIDTRDELVLTLFMFWSLNRQTGYPRYLTMRELLRDSVLRQALAQPVARDIEEAIRIAVDQACARGSLLKLCVADEEGEEQYLFVNTPQGRKAVKEVKAGTLVLERPGFVREPKPIEPQPTIYELYEQNIGLLQPLIAERLKEAARDYPQEWIEDAFRIAVERNVRHWRYIEAILERWSRDGKDDGNWDSGRPSRRVRR
ncbi:MAG: DnaD domain protein [Anaerolineae bacterium]|nr:DnaD domain protein [Anaerolineae bacterium]